MAIRNMVAAIFFTIGMASSVVGSAASVKDVKQCVCVTAEDCPCSAEIVHQSGETTDTTIIMAKKGKSKKGKSLMDILGCEVEVKVTCSKN